MKSAPACAGYKFGAIRGSLPTARKGEGPYYDVREAEFDKKLDKTERLVIYSFPENKP